MKKLSLLCLSLFSLYSFSQGSIEIKNNGTGLVLAPNATVNVATTPETNFKVVFDIKNISAVSQTYTAKRYDVLLNMKAASTASAYFCFGGDCYGIGTFVSPNNLVLGSGGKASDGNGRYDMLTADLDEVSAIGYSIVKYTFANVNNASDTVQVTIKYNDANVGIKENTKSTIKLELYPNPSNTGLVTLKGDGDFSKVEVINQLGSVILSKNTSSADGRVNLDLSSVAAGVYYIKVYSGTKFRTEKLVVTNSN